MDITFEFDALKSAHFLKSIFSCVGRKVSVGFSSSF